MPGDTNQAPDRS